ncbi:MAG: hypothetical protein PSV22_12520 [Pseudolabrys sp.]|nr:hypothetical protein [Pseudolabrys sp.]
MPPSSNAARMLALAAAAVLLAGCSDYLDRRDTISLQGGNAMQTNKVTQMVDPWPRASADRNIAYNGAVMQTAVERYRTGRVIRPNGTGTSATYQGAQSNNAAPALPAAPAPPASPN